MSDGYGVGPKVALFPRYATAALEAAGGCDLSSAGDRAWFDIPFKCRVIYAGLVVTTIVSGDAVVKFDRRHTAGSDGSDRTDGTIASITLPDGTAVGTMVYDKAAQGSLTKAAADLLITAATCRAGGGYWNETTSLCKPHPYGELQPGNEVVVQVVSGTTGDAAPILIVEMLDEVMANLDNVLETA